MAIDFDKTFGARAAGNKPAQQADRPKSQYWLNLGYTSDVEDEDGSMRFVSLPIGIPLDNQERLPTNSRNQEFAAFQSARNDLLDQIQEVAKSLEPGEYRTLNLEIQLRRVNDDAPEISADANPFTKKLDL
jgi:hypothetical protein